MPFITWHLFIYALKTWETWGLNVTSVMKWIKRDWVWPRPEHNRCSISKCSNSQTTWDERTFCEKKVQTIKGCKLIGIKSANWSFQNTNNWFSDNQNFVLFKFRKLVLMSRQISLLTSQRKNTVISPDFMVRKFCGKVQFPHSFRQITQNYARTVPFHKFPDQ